MARNRPADAEAFWPFERLDESRIRATGGFDLAWPSFEVARMIGMVAQRTAARGNEVGGARFTTAGLERQKWIRRFPQTDRIVWVEDDSALIPGGPTTRGQNGI